jgi:hypothetical protein
MNSINGRFYNMQDLITDGVQFIARIQYPSIQEFNLLHDNTNMP